MLKGLSWPMALVLSSFAGMNSWAQQFHPYYGEDFSQSYKQMNQLDFERLMGKLYNSYHLKRVSKPDQIADSCLSEKGSNCYRHTQNKYSDARAIVTTQLDLQSNQRGHFIWEVYCDRAYTEADFPGGQGPNPKTPPNHDILNIEHTWPQSRFTTSYSKELQKGDLHHLYPSDSTVNAQRGNLPFAEVEVETQNTECPETSKLGMVDRDLPLPQKAQTYFEPPIRHRGNIARALFYFTIRYKMEIDPVEEHFLRKWHNEDPVDSVERERHEKIYSIQGNRNPFIDFPELVARIKDF